LFIEFKLLKWHAFSSLGKPFIDVVTNNAKQACHIEFLQNNFMEI